MFFRKNNLLKIQYAGNGTTQASLLAVLRLFQYDENITEVKILSSRDKFALLVNIDPNEWIAVKSGFSTGYPGEGPRGFSRVLQLFMSWGIENIDEYEVPKSLLKRLDNSALTKKNADFIFSLDPVRPKRLYEYINESDWETAKNGEYMKVFRPVIPFGIIDPRIADLAVSFWKNPNDNIMLGYKRLEDVLRKRTGLKEDGSKLFSRIFLAEEPCLMWEGIRDGEQKSRGNLFKDLYSAYRNPRAHTEKEHRESEYVSEFLLLNHLFCLESEALDNQK